MKNSNQEDLVKNEIFYAKHMMKQMEIECGRELTNSFPTKLPPKKQRKEIEFEWERDSKR